MLINFRVDYTIADIETMENVSKDMNQLFLALSEKYSICEYVEISTCNRKEFFIHNDDCNIDDPLLDSSNGNIIIEYGDDAILHLLRMTSGLESMIVGEDQILGQVKSSKNKAFKEKHLGNILDTIFTKAIHVGQVVRNKTNINRGFVSIGSAAIDLAEKHLGSLEDKVVLIIGAGKMGRLVAKALSEKNLEAIFVANRTYYVAVKLADKLGGEAILFDKLNSYFKHADVIIGATGAPHAIITKERLAKNIEDNTDLVLIDIANPRDISEDVEELGVKLFNIDDLREIAELNKLQRQKESVEAEKIIDEEFVLLKESFKLLEVNDILAELRYSMEQIRQKETQKATSKLNNDSNSKVLDNLTKSIVNKIFFDISKNLKKAAKDEDTDILEAAKYIFKE